jgi:hypothetical protein
MKLEVMVYAFARGISIDEAISELAAEAIAFFEKV